MGVGFVFLIVIIFGFLVVCVILVMFKVFDLENLFMLMLELEFNCMISFDGVEFGLMVWEIEVVFEIVIVGVYGMNDYVNVFYMVVLYWVDYGIIIYVYD